MVTNINEYACDLCDSRYETSDLAQQCEDKGISGIEIVPGLLLGNWDINNDSQYGYNLILTTEKKGHHRKHSYIHLRDSLDRFNELKDVSAPTNSVLGAEKQDFIIGFQSFILDDDHFDEMTDLIMNHTYGHLVRTHLEIYSIENLIQNHAGLKDIMEKPRLK